MNEKELREFIDADFPKDWITTDCPGGTTGILSNRVDNKLIEDCLEDIRQTLWCGDELSHCQKFFLLISNYT